MKILCTLGWVAGIVGLLLCVASVALRVQGAFWIAGFQTGTLLLAGVAAMVFGCFCFLAFLTERLRGG